MISATSTLTEVAFEVCTALDKKGFTAVLTGGSAATYYAPEAYQSRDLDFVLTFRGVDGEQALMDLGYHRKGDFYVHNVSPLPLEFPPGPLAVGEDHIAKWSTVKRRKQVLHVLTPFDSVRDRLASYLAKPLEESDERRVIEQCLELGQARPDRQQWPEPQSVRCIVRP